MVKAYIFMFASLVTKSLKPLLIARDGRVGPTPVRGTAPSQAKERRGALSLPWEGLRAVSVTVHCRASISQYHGFCPIQDLILHCCPGWPGIYYVTQACLELTAVSWF